MRLVASALVESMRQEVIIFYVILVGLALSLSPNLGRIALISACAIMILGFMRLISLTKKNYRKPVALKSIKLFIICKI